MARTSIPVEEVPFQGYDSAVTFSGADAANGMMFPNDGRTVLLVRNSDAAAKTVTVVSVADEARRTGDHSISIAAGNTAVIGPLRPGWWNQRSGADGGNVYVDFSAATAVTVGCLRLNQ